jgi:RNA polymerase sigma-70 factor, ECF subfamily
VGTWTRYRQALQDSIRRRRSLPGETRRILSCACTKLCGLATDEFWQAAEAGSVGLGKDELARVLLAIGVKYNYGMTPGNSATRTQVVAFLRSLQLRDLALAQACALGREAAWQQFMATYKEPLTQAAIGITRSATMGHELADSFYSAMFGFNGGDGERRSPLAYYSGRGSFKGFLRAAPAQRHVDSHRRTYRETPLPSDDLTAAPAAPTPPAADLLLLLGDSLRATLGSLDSEERFLLSAWFLDRRTLLEISRTLRVHEATVSRRIGRLTTRLHQELLASLEASGMSRAAAAIVAFPLTLVILAVGAVALRRHETSDREYAPRPDPRWVAGLATLEDYTVTNQFSAMGSLKPGLFRRVMLRIILFAINLTTYTIFTKGRLARVHTIHFARWVYLDGGTRIFFASNYDGSLESYMDDFINKVAFGLNVVFSNGVGYPKTDWLFFKGAKNEQLFKYFIRRHELPTEVWYSARDGLTASNLERNSLIRHGPRKTFDAGSRVEPVDGDALSNMPGSVERGDIQGLAAFSYGKLTGTRYILARIKDPAAARAWCSAAPVSSARVLRSAPDTAIQIAFTADGLRALGVPERVISGFSTEFIEGMGGTANRSRRLGDIGASDPALWSWGGPEAIPHVAVLLYAKETPLAAWQESLLDRLWQEGFESVRYLETSNMGNKEPSVFATGSANRRLTGIGIATPRARPRVIPTRFHSANSCWAIPTNTENTRTGRCCRPRTIRQTSFQPRRTCPALAISAETEPMLCCAS